MPKTASKKINYLKEHDKLTEQYARLAELHYLIKFRGAIEECSTLTEELRCLIADIDNLNR